MSPVFPTVREVLALVPVRHGAPRLVAGDAGLDRRVRWVHVAEVPDIATLLGGGELVLTTGIGLPADDAGLRAFIGDLADVGVSGLVVELGRRYVSGVPRVMAAAAERRGLPLVELRRATPFVRITEAVHALIVDAQLTELRATEEIHQRFTELSVEGAEPAEVVRQAAELAGCPVVLENLSRQVLAYDPAGESAELLLDGWEQHSRRIRPAGRTAYDPHSGWLVTTVGARGQDWGRLLLRWPAGGELTSPDPGDRVARAEPESGPVATVATPPTRLTILIERAASTLALGRLIRRDAEGLERQIHRTLLTALIDHSRPVDEVALRAKALGVTLDRRHLVGVVVRHRADDPAGEGAGVGGEAGPAAGPARLRDLAEAVGQALREAKLTALTSAVDDHAVGALLALSDPAAEEKALAAFAAALRRVRLDADPARPAVPRPTARPADPAPRSVPATADGASRPVTAGTVRATDGAPRSGGAAAPRVAEGAARGGALRAGGPAAVIIAAGSGVGSLREARRSLVEARQIAEAARRDRRDLPIFRLPHVGLAGLLHLLRDEPRLQTFVERELGALLGYDAQHPREQLLDTLRAYLEQGRNKSAAASAAHLSRPAFYERLARIGRILDVDLDSVEACLSLHVALLALDAVRTP
ncbi:MULTISPECIES: PucR family transcriptional regulator [Micromonospora]|uniref:PucR family transcriptional regulator n=1 Tax=Micromonospora solifontis TaxID=2487138 RepID=A0ABX9WFF9_9ACTN|nr:MULTISPECIES: PucR family transcriptional regulator [Micromonospora]NES15020.1 PucR family transcriptional regulator [Micromonospora sp. PPF5-17B]NES37579.1 PucR family transcriptional regulator [Micromonospora solifontis]NES57545.1 PucR family transcriptional regulator [Micromonospora sp. PPF5-6]RNL98200.1 PucR family transcriptional regulator [Micromonospora solifontis]